MLNFIAANVAYVLVLEVFRAEGSSVVATEYVPEYAQFLPWLFPQSSDLLLLALVGDRLHRRALLPRRAHRRSATTCVPAGRAAAEYGGVNAKATTVRAMTLSGAIGGVGGAGGC